MDVLVLFWVFLRGEGGGGCPRLVLPAPSCHRGRLSRGVDKRGSPPSPHRRRARRLADARLNSLAARANHVEASVVTDTELTASRPTCASTRLERRRGPKCGSPPPIFFPSDVNWIGKGHNCDGHVTKDPAARLFPTRRTKESFGSPKCVG